MEMYKAIQRFLKLLSLLTYYAGNKFTVLRLIVAIFMPPVHSGTNSFIFKNEDFITTSFIDKNTSGLIYLTMM